MSDPRFVAFDMEMVDGVPVATFGVAEVSLDAAIDLTTTLVGRMVAEGHPHLLVDARNAAFAIPTLVDRLRMVRQWADAARGVLRLAMVVRPEVIDPERFGVVAAGNFGLATQVFDNDADALRWLREERLADVSRTAWLSADPIGKPVA